MARNKEPANWQGGFGGHLSGGNPCAFMSGEDCFSLSDPNTVTWRQNQRRHWHEVLRPGCHADAAEPRHFQDSFGLRGGVAGELS